MARKTEPVTTKELDDAIEAIRTATSAGADLAERLFKTLRSEAIVLEREKLYDLMHSQAALQKLFQSVSTLHAQRQDMQGLEAKLRAEISKSKA